MNINVNNFILSEIPIVSKGLIRVSFLAESVDIAEIIQLACEGLITDALRYTLISAIDFP
jgi:hypothetical protein